MGKKIIGLTMQEKLELYSMKYLLKELKLYEREEFLELLIRFYNEYLYQRGMYVQKLKKEVKVIKDYDY